MLDYVLGTYKCIKMKIDSKNHYFLLKKSGGTFETSRKLHKLRIFSEDFHLLTSVLLLFSEGLPQFNGDRTISSKSDNI